MPETEAHSVVVSRRGFLRVAGLASVGSVLLVSSVACSSFDAADEAPEPDPLLAQRARARRDANDATAAAAVLTDRAAALIAIAAERTAHADALDAEIARLTPAPASSTTAAVEPSGSPTAPPELEELRSGLTESARSAGDLARSQSGYRAGLLGSISAACAVEVSVLLA